MDARTDMTETQTAASVRKPAQSEVTPVHSGEGFSSNTSAEGSSSNTVGEVHSQVDKMQGIHPSRTTNSNTETARPGGVLTQLLLASRSELHGLLAETQKSHERSW